MKKAKFTDEFKMITGSCVGHFDENVDACKVCKISDICKHNKANNIFPRSEAEVKKFINVHK